MENITLIKANGKLLLTGEYFVLDGALCIGLPTRFSQTVYLIKSETPTSILSWKAQDMYGDPWYEQVFDKDSLLSQMPSDQKQKDELTSKILAFVRDHNPNLWPFIEKIQTRLDFPLSWGLGTSSTLIYGISYLTHTDPFDLNDQLLGGSGYDIACAGSNSPILYQRMEGEPPLVKTFDLHLPNSESFAFIYLGQKANTQKAIHQYKTKGRPARETINRISEISQSIAQKVSLSAFIELLREHEQLVSNWIGMPTLQSREFSDFNGVVKSLGAWGGDFALAVASHGEVDFDYFYRKGYPNVLPPRAIILN